MRCLKCMHLKKDAINCPNCNHTNSFKANQVFHLNPGIILKEKYYIGLSIGEDDLGITYIGYDLNKRRKIVVKEFFPKLQVFRNVDHEQVNVKKAIDQEEYVEGLKSFLWAAVNVLKVSYTEGIAEIFDYFEDNGTGYIITEYVEGTTLKEFIDVNKNVSYEDVMQLVIPLLDSLQQLHDKGVIHRDISANNILITLDGTAKLIGLGGLKKVSDERRSVSSVQSENGFSPIEIYQSKYNQGDWTDVYSICAVIYFLLTAKEPQNVMLRLEDDQLESLIKQGVNIEKNTEIAIMNGLNIQVENRIQNIRDLKQSLLGQQIVHKVTEKNKNKEEKKQKRLVIGIVSIALIGTITLFCMVQFGLIDASFLSLSDSQAQFGDEANVPNLVNLSLEEAVVVAQEAGFQIVTAEGKVQSETVAKDIIMDQDYQAGQLLATNSVITVTVSAGPEMIEVENYLFQDVNDAKSILEELGFVVEIEAVEDTSYYDGAVISQSVEPYSLYGKRSKITLIYANNEEESKSNDSIKVPDLSGMTLTEAHEELAKIGLYLKLDESIFTLEDEEFGLIVEQSQTNEITVGTIVEVRVSKGTNRVHFPDLELMNVDAVIEQLEQLGIKEEEITIIEKYDSSVAKGQVVSQSVNFGEKFVVGNSIEIIVSLGKKSEPTTKPTSTQTSVEMQTTVKETTTNVPETTRSSSTSTTTTTSSSTTIEETTTSTSSTTEKSDTTTQETSESTTQEDVSTNDVTTATQENTTTQESSQSTGEIENTNTSES